MTSLSSIGSMIPRHRVRLRVSGFLSSCLLVLLLVGAVAAAPSSHLTTAVTSGGTTPTGSKPTNTALPVVSGTATQGQTLSTTDGSWDNAPTGYSDQWQRCNASGGSCSNIGGATASTYTLVYADAGGTVRVLIIATNASGSTEATSNATGVVS